MSLEQIQINTELQPQLFAIILDEEKRDVSQEYLPMWSAENKACFPYFLNYVKDELTDVLKNAENGDKDASLLLSASYQEFRSNIEADMAEYTPEVYELFIEAVSRGDEANSAMFVEEYVSISSRVVPQEQQPQEDDDDD